MSIEIGTIRKEAMVSSNSIKFNLLLFNAVASQNSAEMVLDGDTLS